MYIESVPNRHSPPAILLRESYREGGRVKKRTLLNLSDWPADRIAGFKMLLKGGTVVPSDQQAITIIRSLPHGHVVAALGTARKIGLDRLLGPDGNRCRDLVLALVVSRLLDPGSKLAAARALSPDTASSSLGQQLGLGPVVITQARIAEDLSTAGLDWIPALRARAIKILRDAGALQMSLFEERDMAAIPSPDFPGERLIVCRNQALAAERARRREDLLAATERELARIAAAVARQR